METVFSSMCVCVCVCVYMYIYVCIYIRIYHLSIYVYVSTRSSSLLTCRTVVTCSMLYAQQYLFTVVINKLEMCSSPFNLTRMFLNSFVACFLGLVLLFHLLVNCLRVVWIDCLCVCSVCFDYSSHQVYGRHVLCLRCLRVGLISEGKGFFSFFSSLIVFFFCQSDIMTDLDNKKHKPRWYISKKQNCKTISQIDTVVKPACSYCLVLKKI
jgi:hypothetical protein